MKIYKIFSISFLSLGLLSFLNACTTEELTVDADPIIENTATNTPIDTPLPEELPITTSEMVYHWIEKAQLENGLLESAEHTNFVSLYDNSLAAIVFMKQGKIANAEKIFDFFNNKVQTELEAGTGGFFQSRNEEGNEGGRTWMGDNAWLLIALNHYHELVGNQRYEHMVDTLEEWLRSLQEEDGGLIGGYNEDGTQIPKVTEGIITAFNAVEGYDDFHKNILNYLKNERWDTTNKLLVASPETPAYNYALDLHPLGYGILSDFPEASLQQANRYKNTQIATVNGTQVTGYCFDEDKDVIWLEGTAQMAVAFQQANLPMEATKLLKELEKTVIASTLTENAIGIPYTTNNGSTYGASALWDHADTTPAISSSAWYLFAKLNFSPFSLGKDKGMPEADKFWLQMAAQ